MRQLGVNFYVFYHNLEKMQAVSAGIDDPRFKPVDLNAFPVPAELAVDALTPDQNRALYSEYLGHYQLQVAGTMVGTFTYSIPLKFSREWAESTGVSMFGDPPLPFSTLLNQAFDTEYCYAVELRNPFSMFPHYMEQVHDKFRVGAKSPCELGPFKGSLVVERGAYERFQLWLREVTQYYLANFPWQSSDQPSKFSTSDVAGKDRADLESVAKYRMGLGVVLEQCCAYYFGQIYGDRLLRIGDTIGNATPDPELAAIVDLVKKSNRIVIAFANSNYSDVLRNWVASVRQAGVDNLLIISLDRVTEDICAELKVHTYALTPISDDFPELMRMRVRMFRDLCQLGVDFVNSDLDAMWMKDPLPYLDKLDGDLLIQQGTVQPPYLHEEWGFTLCSGFFLARASRRMELFFKLMLEDDRGDQISLNDVLFRDNVTFTATSTYPVTFRNRIVNMSDEPISGVSDNFSVKVLPHELFQRLVNRSPDAYIKHPQAPKEQSEKLRTLKELDCYFLD